MLFTVENTVPRGVWVLLAERVQYRHLGDAVLGDWGTKFPESDNVFWNSVIRTDFGERFTSKHLRFILWCAEVVPPTSKIYHQIYENLTSHPCGGTGGWGVRTPRSPCPWQAVPDCSVRTFSLNKIQGINSMLFYLVFIAALGTLRLPSSSSEFPDGARHPFAAAYIHGVQSASLWARAAFANQPMAIRRV